MILPEFPFSESHNGPREGFLSILLPATHQLSRSFVMSNKAQCGRRNTPTPRAPVTPLGWQLSQPCKDSLDTVGARKVGRPRWHRRLCPRSGGKLFHGECLKQTESPPRRYGRRCPGTSDIHSTGDNRALGRIKAAAKMSFGGRRVTGGPGLGREKKSPSPGGC